ncbi:chloride channel protein [Limosilactobacillus oris]|uniref:chloride channel protein n=1 Tax=Limosilactobacillus oris TaxID=1632 RepID=UPI00174EA982|nr:chloride channel protein [Limosilactobacillus oris]
MEEKSSGWGLAVTTIILGTIVGTSSLLLSVLLDLTEHVFLHFRESNLVPVDISAGPGRRFLSVLAGGIIAAVIWYFLQRKYHPVSIAKALDGKTMPLGKTFVHVCTQIFFVGTGNSIGRELAPREAGAAIAQKWTRATHRYPWLYLNPEDQKMLIAAAAGAGFAGVYIAPITGAVFCIELLYKKVNARVVAVSMTMSVIATLIGSIVKGYEPYYLVGSQHYGLQLLPLVIILGILNGAAGTFFKAGVKLASKHRAVTKNVLVQLPLLAVLAGGVASFYPQVMGNGRGLAQLAMNANTSRQALLLLLFGLVAKVAITLGTIKCGGYGGILTPSIAAGAVIGVFAGVVYTALVPGITLAQTAVLGAACFLAASQQAPLMAMFMLFEVCHLDYTALLPLALGVALAISTSKTLQKRFTY